MIRWSAHIGPTGLYGVSAASSDFLAVISGTYGTFGIPVAALVFEVFADNSEQLSTSSHQFLILNGATCDLCKGPVRFLCTSHRKTRRKRNIESPDGETLTVVLLIESALFGRMSSESVLRIDPTVKSENAANPSSRRSFFLPTPARRDREYRPQPPFARAFRNPAFTRSTRLSCAQR
jgi:hypothetical protein